MYIAIVNVGTFMHVHIYIYIDILLCIQLIDQLVISQITSGYVFDNNVGYVYAFEHKPCPAYDCNDNLINSVYYKEYLQSDQGSASVLRQVNKIVSSSAEFKQLAGCASAQFSANWAFEVTWIEADHHDYISFGSGLYTTESVSRWM